MYWYQSHIRRKNDRLEIIMMEQQYLKRKPSRAIKIYNLHLIYKKNTSIKKDLRALLVEVLRNWIVCNPAFAIPGIISVKLCYIFKAKIHTCRICSPGTSMTPAGSCFERFQCCETSFNIWRSLMLLNSLPRVTIHLSQMLLSRSRLKLGAMSKVLSSQLLLMILYIGGCRAICFTAKFPNSFNTMLWVRSHMVRKKRPERRQDIGS